MMRLEGKSILVAGAGGIGGELARRYAEEGAGVVLGDINLGDAASLVEEISRSGGKAIATQLDGTDESSIASAVARACKSFGGLDGLHANFACLKDNGWDNANVLDLPLETLDETMRVNARGFFVCTRHALPEILKRGGGSILYTSSVAAYLGETTRLAYAMSKAAGNALMRHVATTYGPAGVRANSIAPGVIMHERLEQLVPELKSFALSLGCLKGRLGRPADIASMSALLMSDEGSFITGQVISIDGGTSMRS